MNCRHCHTALEHVFLDLGCAPPSNNYLELEALRKPELSYPLKVYVCSKCFLVQTEDFTRADELFQDDYAYFSSTSTTWLEHAARYARMITRKLQLNGDSFVVEIASNDGYLLKNFVAQGVPCLGIEPAKCTAEAAGKDGIPVWRDFFNSQLAARLISECRQADLIIGNNVLAHVPDINDFACGLRIALKPGGTITLEFPHLLRLLEDCQFDTIYHEHYSYLSIHAVNSVFQQAGLRIFDVEELPTHGGSLRLYCCHQEDPRPGTGAVRKIFNKENLAGLKSLETYANFQPRAERIKDNFLTFLLEQKKAGKRIAAYGAAAKGNTLLNFAGVKPDLLPYVCDAAPSKQGKFLPGSRIPIVTEERLRRDRPDYVVLLPWNIKKELMQQLSYIGEWGGRFVTVVPALEVTSPRKSKSYIYYTKPSITEKEVAYATDAARTGWGSRCYGYIARFEEAFKTHLETKYAIATSSCTGALHMGLSALGVGPGDEVIMADTNWIATAAPIVHLGAKPVFVDILPDSWCIDPELAEKAITAKTRAIVAVHLYGNLCDMDALLDIGRRHNIPIVEDAAEGLGSIWHGRRAGSMGVFGAFSFHGTKTVTTGEGGMFVTNDGTLYEKVLTLSNHGRARGQTRQFWPDVVGFKYKMSNVQAAIGYGQMERIDELIGRKRGILSYYKDRFEKYDGLKMNPEPLGTVNGAWMPTLVFDKSTGVTREALQAAFAAENIDARVFFYPLSGLPMFNNGLQNKWARDIPGRAINLPSFHEMTFSDQDLVVKVIERSLSEAG